jgi:hypothetical protein
MDSIKDSIERSVKLKLFKNKKDAAYAHIYDTELEIIRIDKFKKGEIKNFEQKRLDAKSAKEAYPKGDRPNPGLYDVRSVEFHQKLIKENKKPLIWMARKNNVYYLLDGAHRVIASNLENKKTVYAQVIII